MQNPVALLVRALGLWFSGRVHARRERKVPTLEDDGEIFVAFREVAIDPGRTRPTRAGATFQVRFEFKNLSARANRVLSLVPIPMIIAQPGFRSKTWLLGQQTGQFMGYYEFDSAEEAEAYWDSLPLRMMRGRAAPGSLTWSVTAL